MRSNLFSGPAIRAAAMLTVLLIVPACEQNGYSQCAPSTIKPCGGPYLGPSRGTLVAVGVEGNLTMPHPGDTSQLTARAHYSDGTSQDVTAEAAWTTMYGSDVVTIPAKGLLKAEAYGVDELIVTYKNVRELVEVRVAPEGAGFIWGRVSAADGSLLIGATVESTSGCGTLSTTTNERGAYVLAASGETTIRVERAGYLPQVRHATVWGDETLNFVLEPAGTGDRRP